MLLEKIKLHVYISIIVPKLCHVRVEIDNSTISRRKIDNFTITPDFFLG